MRSIKKLGLGAVLIVAATAAIGASSASAAALYTDASHSTLVPVGTTAVGTSGTVTLLSGTTTVNSCSSSSLNLKVTQNSGGTVAAQITGGSFSGCVFGTTVTGTPWNPGLVVTGSSTTSGANDVWTNTSVSGVSVKFLGGTYTGNLTSGVTASQPHTAGAPLSLVLSNAGTLTGPLTGSGKVNATYVLTGTAAAYSLG